MIAQHLTALRRWRRSPAGFSYAELAKRVNRTKRHILRIAAGEACGPETAKAIRRETGISLDELVGDSLPPEPRARRTPEVRPLETPANRVVAVSRPGNVRRAPQRADL